MIKTLKVLISLINLETLLIYGQTSDQKEINIQNRCFSFHAKVEQIQIGFVSELLKNQEVWGKVFKITYKIS